GSQQQGSYRQDTAAAAHIQEIHTRSNVLFQKLQTEAGSLMGAGAESQTRLQVKHRTALMIILIFPQGTNEKLLSHSNGVKILFPVVDPILFHTRILRDGKRDPLRAETFL